MHAIIGGGQQTLTGRRISLQTVGKYVNNRLNSGKWREERCPADIVGLTRDLTVCRAKRSTDLEPVIDFSARFFEDFACSALGMADLHLRKHEILDVLSEKVNNRL